MMPLPEKFMERMRRELGAAEADALCAALEREASTSVRWNAAKHGAAAPSGRVVEWSPLGRRLDERPAFTLDPDFHGGAYYVQEASSQFAGYILAAAAGGAEHCRGMRVLDVCAAPGGKSTHYASIVGREGLVVANEINRSRAAVLADNVRKWGTGNVAVTCGDAARAAAMTEWFDAVAVDAPCSGEGMFRKSEEARQQWSEAAVVMCAERQVEIALNAFRALRQGGIFIYSTCTFNRTEDEEVLRRIGAELGDELCESADVDADASWGVVTGREGVFRTFRFFPHRVEGEGMFLAVARRAGEAERVRESRNRRSVLAAVDVRTTKELSRWIDSPKPMRFMAAGDTLYGCYAGRYDDIALLSSRMAVIYSGVAMGQIFKGTLRPDGALALFADVSREAVPCRDLPTQEALRFLRKQDMDAAAFEQGVNMVTCGGLPLGFVKRIGARVNNMYPNSLRILK